MTAWVVRGARRIVAVWDRFWFEPAPPARLGLARLIFCGAAFFFYWPQDFTEWATAAPAFWMPIPLFETLHFTPLPAESLRAAQWVWKLSLAASAIGLCTRPSLIVAAVLALYLLGLPHNFGATQHFDTLVVFAFFVLAVSRSGDARSVDAWWRARRVHVGWRGALNGGRFAERRDAVSRPPIAGPEYMWPVRAMWVLTSLVFFAAGTSKLRRSGLEWAFSDNLRLLLMRAYYHVSDGDPLTTWGLAVAQHPRLAQTFAAATLMIETFYFISLLSRRARPFIGVAGLIFLVAIRTLMGPTFEPFMMCALLAVPWHRVEWALRRLVARRPVERPRQLSILDAAYDCRPAEAARAQASLDTQSSHSGVLGPAA
jgi:hypothetical protein